MSFDSENLIALNFNKVIRYKTKTKKSVRPKRIRMKPWLKNRNDKSACSKLL